MGTMMHLWWREQIARRCRGRKADQSV
jgi:hypothetical protein